MRLFDKHGVTVDKLGSAYHVNSPCHDGTVITDSIYGDPDLALARAQHLAKWEKLNRFFIKQKVTMHEELHHC